MDIYYESAYQAVKARVEQILSSTPPDQETYIPPLILVDVKDKAGQVTEKEIGVYPILLELGARRGRILNYWMPPLKE